MSVEIVLIPLAFAAISAWQASKAEKTVDGRIVHQVTSRMRNEELLHAALTDTGGIVTSDLAGVHVHWTDVDATFTRDQAGIWSAHITGDANETQAVGIVTAVDAAYGKRVQQALIQTLRERAASAGMAVESETLEDDQAYTMILTVNEGG